MYPPVALFIICKQRTETISKQHMLPLSKERNHLLWFLQLSCCITMQCRLSFKGPDNKTAVAYGFQNYMSRIS